MGRLSRRFKQAAASLRDGGSDEYDVIELTPDVIAGLNESCADRFGVHVMPHKEGGGIPAAVDLLTSVHPMRDDGDRPTHSFEIKNVNDQIGFQWVMGTSQYKRKIARQLETFYPDSHIETDEKPKPEIVPLRETWYLAGAELRLKLDGRKTRYYPIKHIDVEGFENDPYGSITSEMVGEREAESTTNVATQVIFRPAPSYWHKSTSLRDPSIHDVADQLERNPQEATIADGIRNALSDEAITEVMKKKDGGKNKKTAAAAEAVRRQAGEKGYEINIRVLAVGEDPETTIRRVDETADMFEGYYDSDTQQGFDCVPMRGDDLVDHAHRMMGREYVDRSITMGVRTAAGVIHIPNDSINTQNVTFSHTSDAGDVPPDHPRFSEFDSTGWDQPHRSVTMDPRRWNYAITQRQPTEKEMEIAKKIERAEARGEPYTDEMKEQMEVVP